MRRTALSLCLLFLTGCATMSALDNQVDFNPAVKTTVYRDQWVRRGAPEVHVKPARPPLKPPTVLFIPFRVTQEMDNPGILGYSIARVVWQTWSTMELFPVMEFSGDDVPFRRDRAVALGRQRGADMVVGGFVTYVYAGGSAGDTQVSLQLEAYDTASGQMVWSFAHGGIMPASSWNDYFLFITKTRLPSDPVQAVTKVLAMDMGRIIQELSDPPAASTGWKKRDEDIRDALFTPRDQVVRPSSGTEDSAASF